MELEIKKNKKRKGFTLIELLVALAVFSIVAVGITSIMISGIKSQRKAFALQQVQGSTRYVLELMIKEIRTSEIISGSGTHNILRILNSEGETVRYRFNSDVLERRLNSGGWQSLTPEDVEVSGNFYVQKGSFPNWAIVTIPITLEIENSSGEGSKIKTQSTITSRSFN